MKSRVLRTNRRVVKSRGHRMRIRHLSREVLEQIRKCPLQHARRAAVKARGVLAQVVTASASFHADQLHSFVFYEVMEDANGIRAAAHASNNRRGQFAFGLE